jgi:putative membrane protein
MTGFARATLTALAAIWSTPSLAQEAGSPQTRNFVAAAAQSDNFEIAEAQSALAESKDPRILAFARQMIEAHSETRRQLEAATARAGLKPPPTGISGDQASFLGALQSQKGREFDIVYARQQVLAHRAALVVAQQYAASGDQADLRKVADAASPVIASHLKMAEQIQSVYSAN